MKKKDIGTLIAGMALGAALTGGAVAAGIEARPSWSPIYVDGEQVELTAYNIGGCNYVQLRDMGRAVGFNVYWDDGVQVDTTSPYTGVAPAKPEVQQEAPPQEADSAGAASEDGVEAILQEIVDRTNAARAEHGLSVLTVDEKLTEAAQVRAEEMAATGVYSHTRPDGTSRITTTDSRATAENIHRVNEDYLAYIGQTLPQTLVEDWMGSESHRQIILTSGYTKIGIGLAKGVDAMGQEWWYCAQWFLREGGEIAWVDTPIRQK